MYTDYGRLHSTAFVLHILHMLIIHSVDIGFTFGIYCLILPYLAFELFRF
jgi:hypothetical protein